MCFIQIANTLWKWYFCFVLNSDESREDAFLVDRTLQALETTDWIRQTSSKNLPTDGNKTFAPDIIILGGDLNTEPGFLPYRVLTQFGSMIDKNGRSMITNIKS